MKSSRSKKNNPNKRMAASVHEGMASGVAKFRHSYSHSKRIIALVLALAMVLGLVYVDGKRKEARADSVTQEDATSYQATESFVDNGYITSLFGSGDLYTFINGYTPVDGVDGITILAPYRLLSFDVPAVDDATAEATEVRMGAMLYTKDKVTEMRRFIKATLDAENENYRNLIDSLESGMLTLDTNLDEVEASIALINNDPKSIVSGAGESYGSKYEDYDDTEYDKTSNRFADIKTSADDDEDEDYDDDEYDDDYDEDDDDFLDE